MPIPVRKECRVFCREKVHHSSRWKPDMRVTSSALGVILSAFVLSHGAAAKPKWCESAKAEAEKTVCATPSLWASDECEDGIYRAKREVLAGQARAALDTDELAWIEARNRCGTNAACIKMHYDARLKVLDPRRAAACLKAAAPVTTAALPKPANCMTATQLTAIAGQTKVTASVPAFVEHGSAIEVYWSLPHVERAGTPLFLIGAVPDGARFAREKREDTPGANFVALPGAARAPWGIGFGAGKTRVVVPIHDPDVAREGRLWMKPFIAGPLTMEWAVVAGGPGCADVPPQPIATVGPFNVAVGAPQVVIQDFIAPDPSSELRTATEALRLQEIELSADGRYRLEIFGRRYRVFDIASGAKIVDRSGVKPRFSPTGRFVVASAGDPDQAYPTNFELIDLAAGRVVDHAGGPILAWSNGDAMLMNGARAYQGVEFINTLVDPVERGEDGAATRPYFFPGCGTCDAWASSNIRVDWDRLVALRSNNSEPEKKTRVEGVVALASGKAADADMPDERKPLNALLARLYGPSDVLLDIGWHSNGKISLTHVGRGYDGYVDEGDGLQPTSPKRPSQTKFLSPRRLALADGKVLLPDDLSRGHASSATHRAAWRSEAAKRTTGGQEEPYIEAELKKYGLAREPAEPIAEIAIPKDKDEDDDIARPWPPTLKAELLAANPQVEPWFGKDEDFARTIAVAAWRFDFGGSNWVLVQHGDPAHTANGAHQLRFDLVAVAGRERGRIVNIEALGGLFSQFVGREHTIARPMLARDERLIIPIPGTGQAAIVKMAGDFPAAIIAMNEPTLLCGFFSTPGRALLMQSNCDGRLFVFDAAKGPAAMLSGRIVDDELILYNAQGYYAATYEGAHFVHLAFPGLPGVHSFEQFAKTLQRPDYVRAILGSGATGFPAPKLSPPPELTLSAAELGAHQFPARVKAHSDSGLAAIAFYEDGRLFHQIAVSGNRIDSAVTLPRKAHIRSITAVATDTLGFRSQPATVAIPRGVATVNTLHVIAVGVDAYDNIDPLTFAKTDAAALVKAAQAAAPAYYHGVRVTERYDREANPARVLADLRAAATVASQDDTILVFFAGHGTRTSDGRYFMATTETRLDAIPETSLAWDAVADILGKTRGRVVMVVDACHSGQTGDSQGTNDEAVDAIAQRAGAPIVVLAASKGRQLSNEMPETGGGVFTQSLAAVLGPARAQADANRNGLLEVSEIYRTVKEIVAGQTSGGQTPWLVRRNLSGDFPLF
jgi:uncharacterized protein